MSEEDHPVVPHEMSQLVKGIGAAPDRPFIGLGIQGLNDMAHTLHLEGGGIARRWRRRGLAPRRLMGGKPGGGGFCQEYGEAQEAQFGRRCPQRMEWRFQNTAFGKGMRIWIHLRIVGNDDSVISEDEIPQLDKGCDRLEAIGLSLAGTKAVLANTQERLVTAQTVAPPGSMPGLWVPWLPAAQQLVAPDPVPYRVRRSPPDQPAPLSLSPPIRGGHDLHFVN